MNRVLGVVEGSKSGPLVILIGGLHGNEETGVHAIVNVFRSILELNLQVNGKIVGLIGNTRAYEKGERYLSYDLNRCWNPDFINNLKRNHDPASEKVEDFELLELLGEIDHFVDSTHSPKVLVDLHSTSSDNGNFIVIPQDEADNSIVKSLLLPIVVDLEKYLNGTLLEYMHTLGFVSFAFEGGLIGSQKSLNLHTSGVWELLYAAKSIERRHDHEFSKYDAIIDSFIHELPHKVSVLYRHRVQDGDGFEMLPGFHNFQKVKKGDLLARDHKGEIIAREDGLIFMPLYQQLGDDGFFVVEEIEQKLKWQ